MYTQDYDLESEVKVAKNLASFKSCIHPDIINILQLIKKYLNFENMTFVICLLAWIMGSRSPKHSSCNCHKDEYAMWRKLHPLVLKDIIHTRL